jgi:hypothetical protein
LHSTAHQAVGGGFSFPCYQRCNRLKGTVQYACLAKEVIIAQFPGFNMQRPILVELALFQRSGGKNYLVTLTPRIAGPLTIELGDVLSHRQDAPTLGSLNSKGLVRIDSDSHMAVPDIEPLLT